MKGIYGMLTYVKADLTKSHQKGCEYRAVVVRRGGLSRRTGTEYNDGIFINTKTGGHLGNKLHD